MIKRVFAVFVGVLALASLICLPSCKSCNKSAEQKVVPVDTTAVSTAPPINNITLPHADTALIPVLSKILDDVFAASAQKDYNRLGSYIIFRGPDPKRLGQDVFNAKLNYDRAVVRITSDVFNKWNRNVESHNYTRVFNMDQPGGKTMVVLEVLFVSNRNMDRKFFGFVKLNDEYKILDVTSNL